MFRVEVHENVRQIIALLYRTGFWHRNDEETVKERRVKKFYAIYHCLLPVSFLAGIFAPENSPNDKICLTEEAIIGIVLYMKLLCLIWRKQKILEHLTQICEYHIDDRETFMKINNKLNNLMKFVKLLFTCVVCGICMVFVASVVGAERTLFVKIGFPLDWRRSEFGYWTAFIFVLIEGIISAISVLFSVLVWYLMANCCWRYEVLGNQIERLGELRVDESSDELKVSDAQKNVWYQEDLIETIESWNQIDEY